MPKAAHKVVVIGHRNPDTDSICSAIAYAELKNKTTDLVCEPRRAGKMNQETEFVLKKFGVTPPRMCTDVNPKIRVVIYTLEFSIMSRIPGMLWENGIEPTEIMQLEVSKVGRKDEIEVQPAPWIFSGQAGRE